MDSYEKSKQAYLELGFIDGQKEKYDQVEKEWQDFKKTGAEAISLYKSESKEDYQRMLQIFLTDCPAKAKKFTVAMEELGEFHRRNAVKKVASAERVSGVAATTVVAIVVVGGLFSLIVGFLFATSLATTLGRIGIQIASASEETASASVQLSAASSKLSESSTESAASFEETVASLEELTSMVKMNTASATQANELSQASQDSAEKGASEIEKLIDAMRAVAVGSKKIEEITNVIDDIAFQTNLLALNAAVEAARAGEQGRGFAVVAEAVRTLAQKSSLAAKDINHLIKENVEKSESGALIADGSGLVLKEILSSVKKVAALNVDIAGGSKEQAAGIEQISKAMNQLDQTTQANAASAEEVAASSTQMLSQSGSLKVLVSDLNALLGSNAGVKMASTGLKAFRGGAKPSSEQQIPFDDEAA